MKSVKDQGEPFPITLKIPDRPLSITVLKVSFLTLRIVNPQVDKSNVSASVCTETHRHVWQLMFQFYKSLCLLFFYFMFFWSSFFFFCLCFQATRFVYWVRKKMAAGGLEEPDWTCPRSGRTLSLKSSPSTPGRIKTHAVFSTLSHINFSLLVLFLCCSLF